MRRGEIGTGGRTSGTSITEDTILATNIPTESDENNIVIKFFIQEGARLSQLIDFQFDCGSICSVIDTFKNERLHYQTRGGGRPVFPIFIDS